MLFSKLCCAASDAAAEAGEVISAKAAEVHKGVKDAANSFTLGKLKSALEGAREQEWNEPDMFVEILEVELEDGIEVPNFLNFNLRGLKVKTKVDIIGTTAQLAGMVATVGAEKAGAKVSDAEAVLTEKFGLPALGIGQYVAASAAGAKAKLASSASDGTETKTADFDLLVDLEKMLGREEVKATARIVSSSSDVLAKYLSNGTLQAYVEDGISRRVTQILTGWQNSTITLDKAKEAVVAKAGELATAADTLAKSQGVK